MELQCTRIMMELQWSRDGIAVLGYNCSSGLGEIAAVGLKCSGGLVGTVDVVVGSEGTEGRVGSTGLGSVTREN